MKGIIGKKVGMTQLIDPTSGKTTAVTVIQAGPCFVTKICTTEQEGYSAVQLGYEELPPENLRYLREFRVKSVDVTEGQRLTVEVFANGDKIDVVGISKGRGFAGTIKRHNFNRQPTTHGASDRTRAPGSSSSGTTPGRVKKGTRRSGHMGTDRVTTQNLEVMAINIEKNLIAVKGSIPGATGGLVILKESVKTKSRSANGAR
jgi:large subunit ribosomal protein L3